MSLRINLNVAAMNAQRQLAGTDNALGSSIEKLSSGYKINRAADNPAWWRAQHTMWLPLTWMEMDWSRQVGC